VSVIIGKCSPEESLPRPSGGLGRLPEGGTPALNQTGRNSEESRKRSGEGNVEKRNSVNEDTRCETTCSKCRRTKSGSFCWTLRLPWIHGEKTGEANRTKALHITEEAS
jgi:hypothetical protein